MKLIVQIPAFNEEGTLAKTISEIPRTVAGVDKVEILVIDDGSTDKTVDVAKAAGADHILRMPTNVGLAGAFTAGIEASLQKSADIIVNTDADNQYCAADIPKLIAPILNREAQIVVGARPISEIESFSPIKKVFQRLGSWVVRKASGTQIPDAPSGFRAYSKSAAARLYVINPYTYTLETIIQAGRKRIPMTSVPIRVNPVTRPSRLFRSMREYIFRSSGTIIRISIVYAPLRFFFTLAALFALPGLVAIARFLVHYAAGDGSGNIQSLVLASALLAMATVLCAVGILADLIAANRHLLEDIRAREMLRYSDMPKD
ncbi:glycosyltransferase family 2 protein [Cognatishimia maritima]|uniref:Glycosyltransferase involved in cell wall bisynthesis n=1 Tax=Cognatishimia maritima TaxID=870908 RepID=A0A1M5WDN4_9RHOB|nr:glycosyltransferase family 2 protein [Cognatishimia maritima]SHH85343.1 Glycosyltransferase involved in cell wall bisynthesis [Cognatishimia maritima]